MLGCSHCYKASWIASYRCTFSGDDPPQWKYHKINIDKDDWSATPCVEIGEPIGTRINLSERAEFWMNHKLFDRWLNNLDSFSVEKKELFSWLPEDDKGKTLEDEGVAILLNHIMASRSTKPLETVISVVGAHRSSEIRGLSTGQPCWFYTPPNKFINYKNKSQLDINIWKRHLGNYLLSFPKLFIKNKTKIRSPEIVGDILNAHRQTTKIFVLKYKIDNESCILQLRMDAELCRYERGALCNCIPIPGISLNDKVDPPEPIGVNSPEVVVSSPLVKQALEALSDIWQDKATAILISAPPGSGKEHFTLSIPFGSGRKGQKVPTISLADGKPEQLENLLFGYQQTDGSIVDGLLAKAKGFALFIDEAHYPTDEPGIRAKLLRPLEAKEYFPIGSLEPRKVEDVQWLFASSLPLDGCETALCQLKPNDFWTRMTHVIRIEHPLDKQHIFSLQCIGDKEIKSLQMQVITDIFKFFWWDRLKSHFGIDPSKVLLEISKKDKSDDLREKDAAEQLSYGHVNALLKSLPLNTIAKAYAESLMTTIGSESLQEVSVRGIRSMVSRIFSRCVGAVTAGSVETDWGKVFHDNKIKHAPEEIYEYIIKVVNETQKIAKLAQ